jgi:hypothetical protein
MRNSGADRPDVDHQPQIAGALGAEHGVEGMPSAARGGWK